MVKVLVVEDDTMWKGVHQRNLGRVVGEENIDMVDDYAAAIALSNQRVYDAYVLDGEFPRSPGQKPEPLGVQLATDISQKVGGYERIRLVSGRPSVLDEAFQLGIKKLYSKGLPDEGKGQKPVMQLALDLKQEFNL